MFYYDYNETKRSGFTFDEKLDFEESAVRNLITLLGGNLSFAKQIHIPIGINIFNIKPIYDSKKKIYTDNLKRPVEGAIQGGKK